MPEDLVVGRATLSDNALPLLVVGPEDPKSSGAGPTLTLAPPSFLFDNIRRFHEKFDLRPAVNATSEDPNTRHELELELQRARVKFLAEELLEYCAAVGMRLTIGIAQGGKSHVYVSLASAERKGDMAAALDALVDLAYVTLGTAYLHDFPFDEAWRRVHAANMRKVRVDDPYRQGHKGGVVKPDGWQAPILEDLL